MTDRPILFSGPMVRALLAGTKTQTRRLLKPQPKVLKNGSWYRPFPQDLANWQYALGGIIYAYARVRTVEGDRLYVREHWRSRADLDNIPPREMMSGVAVWYEADGQGPATDLHMPGKHRQAMHMPRWASRLTLTVTDVRVERLQDISEEDAIAEGVAPFNDEAGLYFSARDAYWTLWDQINGAGSWDANPWVVAYSFSVERQNIDLIERAA
jgi:hypothetical protein